MLFALICKDKGGAQDIRAANRPDHLAFLDGLGEELKSAGPFVDEEGSPIGSLVIVEADDIKGARAIAGNDPYARARLFESVEIIAWKWLIKNPENR